MSRSRSLGSGVCAACLGTKQVTRYGSSGYDHPPRPFMAPCPLCVPMAARSLKRGVPMPFPMHLPRGKQ